MYYEEGVYSVYTVSTLWPCAGPVCKRSVQQLLSLYPPFEKDSLHYVGQV